MSATIRTEVPPRDTSFPSCDLDAERLSAQLGRYRALSRDVVAAERDPRRLRVAFGPGADLELLREAVAVEQRCCPFFSLAVDEPARTLEVEVGEDEQAPALDAIADALVLHA
jgi:hypothetical protein